MAATQQEHLVETDLEDLINKAIKKVRGSKENDICKFLPVEKGGYMHHFTLRKMKTECPRELGQMISKFIINSEKPDRVPPKHRAARGSRKKQDVIMLTKVELDRVLGHIRSAGDQELAVKLSPKKSLSQAKKQLIASIRHNRVELELWTTYVEAVHHSNNPVHASTNSANLVNVTTIQANR